MGGTQFGLEVTWAGQRVTLEETAIPPFLTGLAVEHDGTLSDPSDISLTWSPESTATKVLTRIDANHHAGVGTFVECIVDANSGHLQIDEAMLDPLAVATGLEFGSLQHSYVAAADTALGCVEFRFYVNQRPEGPGF